MGVLNRHTIKKQYFRVTAGLAIFMGIALIMVTSRQPVLQHRTFSFYHSASTTLDFLYLRPQWRTVIDFLRNCSELDGTETSSTPSDMMDTLWPLFPGNTDDLDFDTAVHHMDEYWHYKELLLAGNTTAPYPSTCIPWVPPPAPLLHPKPSIALVTISSGVSDAPLSLKDKQQYARKHGYDYHPLIGVKANRGASWWKLPAMFTVFNRYEWVMLLDLDTIILDHSVKLEEFLDPRADFIIGGEPEGPDTWKDILNCGVFIARNSSWTRMFLIEAWSIADVPYENPGDDLWEQTAINRLVKTEQQVRNHIKVIPANQFNRFLPNRWTVKDPPDMGNSTFIIHLTGPGHKYELLEHYYTVRRHVEALKDDEEGSS